MMNEVVMGYALLEVIKFYPDNYHSNIATYVYMNIPPEVCNTWSGNILSLDYIHILYIYCGVFRQCGMDDIQKT
jgi:hypothetical protein